MMRLSNTVNKMEARTENKIIIKQPTAPPTGRMFMRGPPNPARSRIGLPIARSPTLRCGLTTTARPAWVAVEAASRPAQRLAARIPLSRCFYAFHEPAVIS